MNFDLMAFYVYIIQSEKDNSYYKGYSMNPFIRLQQHNNRESTYTAGKCPWKLVYVEELGSKMEALIREKNLKKATLERIEALIRHPKNIVQQFLRK
jgi:putative endonuclease